MDSVLFVIIVVSKDDNLISVGVYLSEFLSIIPGSLRCSVPLLLEVDCDQNLPSLGSRDRVPISQRRESMELTRTRVDFRPRLRKQLVRASVLLPHRSAKRSRVHSFIS